LLANSNVPDLLKTKKLKKNKITARSPLHFTLYKLYKLLALRNPPPPLPSPPPPKKNKTKQQKTTTTKNSPVTWMEGLKSAEMFLKLNVT